MALAAWTRIFSTHAQHHFERCSGGRTHAIERFLSGFERHFDGPRSDVDCACREQREGAFEVHRCIGKGHGDAMLFPDTGHEIDLAALLAQTQQYDEAARPAEVKSGLARRPDAACIEHEIETVPRKAPCV